MILEELQLTNFRCYNFENLVFDHRFNVISGLNGRGKTSILEAVGILSSLKSFRLAKNIELINYNSSQLKKESLIKAKIINNSLDYELSVKIYPTKKLAAINTKHCKFLSDYISKIATVIFCPNDLDIIVHSPELRRNWIDKISQIYFRNHIDALSRYYEILDHRNKTLKDYSEKKIQKLPLDFEIWTDNLIQKGSEVIHNRIKAVDNLQFEIQSHYCQISNQNVDITTEYKSDIFDKLTYRQVSSSSLEDIKWVYRNCLNNSFDRELFLGTTRVGPHRDDLEFKKHGKEFHSFSSQGEIRSLAIAFRLAEASLYKSLLNIKPIILIDDFSSELDLERRTFLLNFLKESDSQVFITTTEEINIGKLIKVKPEVLNL